MKTQTTRDSYFTTHDTLTSKKTTRIELLPKDSVAS